MLVLVMVLIRCLEELGGNCAGGPGGRWKRDRQKTEELQRLFIKKIWAGNVALVFGRDCRLAITGGDDEAKRSCLLQYEEGIPAVHDRVGIG